MAQALHSKKTGKSLAFTIRPPSKTALPIAYVSLSKQIADGGGVLRKRTATGEKPSQKA